MDNIPYGYCQCGCGQQTNLAPASDKRQGTIKGQPYRFLRGHQTRKPILYTVEDRGYTTPCWVWGGPTPSHGYGQFMREHKTHKAHRYMYELHKGAIPEGLEIDHLCRVKRCINPEHLEAVTHRVNLRRADNTKKLSLEQREVIVKLYSTGQYTQRQLADEFGVDQAAICRHIKNARS